MNMPSGETPPGIGFGNAFLSLSSFSLSGAACARFGTQSPELKPRPAMLAALRKKVRRNVAESEAWNARLRRKHQGQIIDDRNITDATRARMLRTECNFPQSCKS